MYKTSDFDFTLPKDLIAYEPCNPRDAARMITFHNLLISHKMIRDLPNQLTEGDVLVFNDTKVIKAKLIGHRRLARVEINLHHNCGNNIWQVFARPAKRLKIGDVFVVGDNFCAEVINKNPDGLIDMRFNCQEQDFFQMLEKYGHMPLPPYIKRNNEQNSQSDDINYQTIFAKNPGAVAAPTAGLHFTDDLIKALKDRGIIIAFVTLNVGAGTFLPVKSELIQDHQMHSEYFTITEENCQIINQARQVGKRIIAVGTTSLRVLESATDNNGIIAAKSGITNIFIYPPYQFKIVNGLLTNFHLPKSTLFMLVCAFVGKKSAEKIYQEAIENRYRFYSYGDACLLLPII